MFHAGKSCIIRSIFAAGGRAVRTISYNKLWKLRIDKKVSEEVTLTVLHKSCSTLEVDIADMTEFTEGEIKWVL